jgi:hypothetical protein
MNPSSRSRLLWMVAWVVLFALSSILSAAANHLWLVDGIVGLGTLVVAGAYGLWKLRKIQRQIRVDDVLSVQASGVGPQHGEPIEDAPFGLAMGSRFGTLQIGTDSISWRPRKRGLQPLEAKMDEVDSITVRSGVGIGGANLYVTIRGDVWAFFTGAGGTLKTYLQAHEAAATKTRSE